MVVWITGLAGSGKTTLATELVNFLRTSLVAAVLVDGDEMRAVVSDPNTGYDRACRLRNAYRISRAARWLERQNLFVVASTISLFHEIHSWNQANFADYFEVLIEVDLEELRRRHPDQLYDQSSVVGLDQQAEFPVNPQLRWRNHGQEGVKLFPQELVRCLERFRPGWLEDSRRPLPPIARPRRV